MKTQHVLRGTADRLGSFFSGFERARHAILYPWRATLLIVVIAPLLHAPLAYTLLVWIGYLFCIVLEQMEKDQKKDQVCGEELLWERDAGDPEQETLGEYTRVRLPREHQIIVTRLAEMLRKMP